MRHSILYISLCLMLPIALLCFYLEKRARRILLSVILGVMVCMAAGVVNNLLAERISFTTEQYAVFFAPVVEEFLKFVAVCAFGIVVKKGKRGSTANAFAVGVGFCVVENFYYLFTYIDTVNVFWIISRSIGTGLMHCMTSALYGVALFYLKNKSKGKVFWVIGTLLCGMAFHAGYNALVQTDLLRVVGVLMPIAAFAVLFYFIKGTDLHDYLFDKQPIDE